MPAVVVRGEAWREAAAEEGADCDEPVVDGGGGDGDGETEDMAMAAAVKEEEDGVATKDGSSLLLFPPVPVLRGVLAPPPVLLAPVPEGRRGEDPLPTWDGEEEMGVNTLEATSGRTVSRGIHWRPFLVVARAWTLGLWLPYVWSLSMI